MTTQIKIDSNLVKRVMRGNRTKSKDRAIEKALEDYLQIQDRRKIVELFGGIDFREGYDYKATRSR